MDVENLIRLYKSYGHFYIHVIHFLLQFLRRETLKKSLIITLRVYLHYTYIYIDRLL